MSTPAPIDLDETLYAVNLRTAVVSKMSLRRTINQWTPVTSYGWKDNGDGTASIVHHGKPVSTLFRSLPDALQLIKELCR